VALNEGMNVIETTPVNVGGTGEREGRVVGVGPSVERDEPLGVGVGAKGVRVSKGVPLPPLNLIGEEVVEKVGGWGLAVTITLCVPPTKVIEGDMEGKEEEEDVRVEPPPAAAKGDPLDKALGPPEGTSTVDEGERVEEGVGSCVPLPPLPPPLLLGEGAPGVGVERRGGECVKNVDGEGKEEWVPLLPPLVGVESIKGEKLGREEEDKERDALELGVVTRPGEAVFPPIAGDGEGETEPPPLPPTADVPVGSTLEAEGEGEMAGERDTDMEIEGEGETLGEAVVESYPLPPLRLVLLTASDAVTPLEAL